MASAQVCCIKAFFFGITCTSHCWISCPNCSSHQITAQQDEHPSLPEQHTLTESCTLECKGATVFPVRAEHLCDKIQCQELLHYYTCSSLYHYCKAGSSHKIQKDLWHVSPLLETENSRFFLRISDIDRFWIDISVSLNRQVLCLGFACVFFNSLRI